LLKQQFKHNRSRFHGHLQINKEGSMDHQQTAVPDDLIALADEIKLILPLLRKITTHAPEVVDRLLDKSEAAAILGVKPSTMSAWISRAKGPRYCKIGSKVYYRRAWLESFVEKNSITNSAR
jgi:predicted DNA-binding transcriptional regulator AlpA